MKLEKLDEILISNENIRLAQSFITKFGGTLLWMNTDGIIHQRASSGYSTVLDGPKSNELDLFYFGVCKLKFGSMGSHFIVSHIPKMKTLKNMPTVAKKLTFKELWNVPVFDLHIEQCEELRITMCAFEDLSHIKNVDIIIIENCKKCDTLDKMPHNLPHVDQNQLLEIKNMDIKQIKTNNNNIGYIKFNEVSGIVNFTHLPLHMEKLFMDSYSFDNWLGIDNYKTLSELVVFPRSKYKNIITLLLCESLTDSSKLTIHGIDKSIKDIIKDFLIPKKEDHVMDCAVELIDAGFEEAAEI